ncbi:MAG: DUF4142 domain-containing protein [Bacteroidetes bacterium]|nr:DUF4142 domain-containing protein [Bacteroidota bacterium]
MKKTNFIKSALFQAAFVSSVFLITSCSNNQKPEDTKDIAEDHNNAKFDNNKNEKDAQFLVDAAEINREEISLGQLAQKSGTTTHVKELGKMMEDAHTQSLADLSALAKTKNISIPTSQTDDGQAAYKKLNEKSGNDFNKAYADMMVNGHKDAITLFETASTSGTDPDIRAWATATLPALRTHLDHSMICQKECSKM